MFEKLYAIIWAAWIEQGWHVEKVKSWNVARLRHSNGTKQTVTFELLLINQNQKRNQTNHLNTFTTFLQISLLDNDYE
jgi:hypothetical protein